MKKGNSRIVQTDWNKRNLYIYIYIYIYVCIYLFIYIQGRSQNLKLGGAALLLIVCSDFGFRLRCYLVA